MLSFIRVAFVIVSLHSNTIMIKTKVLIHCCVCEQVCLQLHVAVLEYDRCVNWHNMVTETFLHCHMVMLGHGLHENK